jgi:hypothetical protein
VDVFPHKRLLMSFLRELIERHVETARLLREAFARSFEEPGGDDTNLDSAFVAEHEAMMRLVSYAPRTVAEARARSLYLLSTRFPDALDEEGLAFLESFTRPRGDGA